MITCDAHRERNREKYRARIDKNIASSERYRRLRDKAQS